MGEWREYSLLELADIYNEKRIPLSKMQRLKLQGIYPYYGASGIVDYVNDYKFDGDFILISEDGENLKTRKTPIAFKASGKFWVNNHAHIIKGKTDYLDDLLVYFFSNLDLNQYLTGAVQPKLSKGTLLNIPVYLPENESEQKAIAEVLSSIDDKIDLLHRQNKTLEELAQTLFRQWFKQEAKDEWEEATIGDIAILKSGKSRPKDNDEINLIPIYGGNGILGYTNQANAENESIIIGRVGAYCGSLYLENKPIWVSDNALLAKAKDEIYTKFLFYTLKNNELNSMAEGSSHPLLTQRLIKSIPLFLPSKDKLLEFNFQVNTWYEKINFNKEQIKTLENMRDTLLPKLMSGEVRVKL